MPVVHQAPRGSDAELGLIRRKLPPEPLFSRLLGDKEFWNERLLLSDSDVQLSVLPLPIHFTEAKSGGSPVILDKSFGPVTCQPGYEIVELASIRQDRGQTHDAPRRRVGSAEEALNLSLIANLSLVKSNHVSFVQHDKANVVQ